MSFKKPKITRPSRPAHANIIALHKIGSRLKFLDDFAAVVALCFGADATLTAAVWGSIRLILRHASSTAETLQDVLDILEELSLTLPRFQDYERTLPLDPPIQKALVEVYSEIICFYARAIHFLRSEPPLLLRKNAWQGFRNDLSRTILRIKRIIATVDIAAERVRMRKDPSHLKEVVALLASMATCDGKKPPISKYNNLPFASNARFSGREEVFRRVDDILSPKQKSTGSRSVALTGMGGIGKTQIAIEYAHRNLNMFDVVLWIQSDNVLSIARSLHTIADGLGLFTALDEQKDITGAAYKVKNWLTSTDSPYLVIFDNADDINALNTIWAGNPFGSFLITTRDANIASARAILDIAVEKLSLEEGAKLLLKSADIDSPSPDHLEQANMISRTFDGLPLALVQVGRFIKHRRMALKEFLPLYERNAGKIDARQPASHYYRHKLSTVWDVSFDKLDKDSAKLLDLLSFVDPDGISEDILVQGSEPIGHGFSFLADEMDLGDAAEDLLRLGLVNRSGEHATMTIHRLVQSAVRKRLSVDRSADTFDALVRLLCWGFPDHATVDIGHQIASWQKCRLCIAHVNHLVSLVRSGKQRPGARQKFAELLLRSSRYLYKNELYQIAKATLDQALMVFDDRSTLEFASALDLGGLIALDLARPESALTPFREALEIRKARLGDGDPFIAYSLNNMALAYTEMAELDQAYACHQEAIRLRLNANSDRIGNSYSNTASLLLRMSRPDDAEQMLARSPSLLDFRDETFLRTGNPRHSGDMVLLSRIRLAQGRHSEALKLASKALQFRRTLLGNRLKTCDSQYDVACMLLHDGHVGSAIQLLEELVSISETFVEGAGQKARALYKLSVIAKDRGLDDESARYREKAMEIRAGLRPDLKERPFEEQEFAKLCLWMLW